MSILGRVRGGYQFSEGITPGDAVFIQEIVRKLIVDSANLHFCHFRTKSGFIHEVLGELYPKYNDWADDLIETQYFAMTQQPVDQGTLSATFALNPYPQNPDQDCINIVKQTQRYLENLLSSIQNSEGNQNTANDSRNTGVENIIENILVELERYHYKLTNLR